MGTGYSPPTASSILPVQFFSSQSPWIHPMLSWEHALSWGFSMQEQRQSVRELPVCCVSPKTHHQQLSSGLSNISPNQPARHAANARTGTTLPPHTDVMACGGGWTCDPVLGKGTSSQKACDRQREMKAFIPPPPVVEFRWEIPNICGEKIRPMDAWK